MSATDEIWRQFALEVKAVDVAAGIDKPVDLSRQARLAFISLHEKYQNGSWSAAGVFRAMNDVLYMPGRTLHLAMAEGCQQPSFLQEQLQDWWDRYKAREDSAQNCLAQVVALLGA
jgi:hypothetical protein